MTIVVLSDGGRDACRKKAAKKVCDLAAAFNSLPEPEQFERAYAYFEVARRAAEACIENFEPANFYERKNNEKPIEEIREIMIGGLQAIHLMENACNVMEGLSISQVNGKSTTLADCVDTASRLKKLYVAYTSSVIVNDVMPAREFRH